MRVVGSPGWPPRLLRERRRSCPRFEMPGNEVAARRFRVRVAPALARIRSAMRDKFSAIILEFAQPLLDACGAEPDSKPVQAALDTAVAVWNAYTLDQQSGSCAAQAQVERAVAKADGPAIIVAFLLERRRTQFRTHPWFVRSHAMVSDGEGGFRLRVEAGAWDGVGTHGDAPPRPQCPLGHPAPSRRARQGRPGTPSALRPRCLVSPIALVGRGEPRVFACGHASVRELGYERVSDCARVEVVGVGRSRSTGIVKEARRLR